MDAKKLRNDINAEEVRPAYLQRYRQELSELLGMHVPRRGVADLDDWWERNKSVVGRKVNDMLDEQPGDSSDEDESEDSSDVEESNEEDN